MSRPKKRPPHLEVHSNGSAINWVRIVAANGEVLQTSEVYTTASSARRAAKKLAAATGLEIKSG